jgi:hypothetical protein
MASPSSTFAIANAFLKWRKKSYERNHNKVKQFLMLCPSNVHETFLNFLSFTSIITFDLFQIIMQNILKHFSFLQNSHKTRVLRGCHRA